MSPGGPAAYIRVMAVATYALDPVAPSRVAPPRLATRWRIGVVPTASMLLGAVIGVVWFWIPLGIAIIALSSIPSVIGFLVAGVPIVLLAVLTLVALRVARRAA